MLCGYENTCVRTGSPGIAKKEEQVYDVFRLKYYLSTLIYLIPYLLPGKLPRLWNLNYNSSGLSTWWLLPISSMNRVRVQWSRTAAAAAQCMGFYGY